MNLLDMLIGNRFVTKHRGPQDSTENRGQTRMSREVLHPLGHSGGALKAATPNIRLL